MPCSLEQFAKSLSISGLMTAEEVKSFHAALPASKRKDVPHFATELVRSGKITRFQAASIYQENALSLLMGDYCILDKIGSGGMGQVFKAEHRRMKRIVALKLLPAEVTKDAQALKRFQREVETAARLIHPNIVTAYDAGEFKGVYYLIMEYVDGQDLSHLVKKQGTLPIETAVNFLAQAARGLEYAHAEGIIHRDIKPANLLVDKKGTIKILDMGLARVDNTLSSREAAATVEGLTGSGVMMGTVDYMAPEQAIDTHAADHRADIYSLGCTLLYLLTGRRMFEGETFLKRILAHRDLPRPALASLRPDLPASLETVFQRMVARLPEDRYATMAAARQALEECLARMDNQGDSSVFQFDNAADEDLASFLKNIQVQSATGVVAPVRLATETLVGSQGASDTKPVSHSRRTAAKQLNWPIVVAAVVGAAVVALLTFMLLSRLSPRPEPPPPRNSAALVTPPEPDRSEQKPAPEPKPIEPKPVEEKASPPPTPMPPEKQPPEPMPVKPEPAPKPAPVGPKQIVVGLAEGQVRDLAGAFKQAAAGDTIVIQHRGPLALPPIDLTDKSPLVIMGGAKDGVDYWPLLVQGPPRMKDGEADAAPEKVPGLLHGKQVDLTLKKLHLAAGGPASQQEMNAVFALSSGRLRIEDCTITVGSTGLPGEPFGPPLPLVQLVGSRDPAELSLERTYVRGPRLAGCLSAAGAGEVRLALNQVLWAGAASPWIASQDAEGPLRVNVQQSTLYNVASVLHWESKAVASGDEPAVRIAASRSLFVAPYANKEPLIAWNASDAQADLAKAVTEQQIVWQGENNVFHRWEGYYREPRVKVLAALPKWRALWGQTGGAVERESDPHFRVWPEADLLQEAFAWDYEPRFWRNQVKTRQIAEQIGAIVVDLPSGIPRATEPLRKTQPIEVSMQPRGVPRVLLVHQKDGPYKTIEDALSEARNGDIVEIADNGPYLPRRNFTINPGEGVLEPKADYLTIRAGRDASPLVLLKDDLQEGSAKSGWLGDWLAYLATDRRMSLVIDGLHFRLSPPSTSIHRSIIAERELSLFRLTNCSFSAPLPSPAIYLASQPAVFWIENSMFSQAPGKNESELVTLHSTSHLDYPSMYWLVRNCLFSGTAFGQNASGSGGPRKLHLALHNNTFLGRIANVTRPGALTLECWENLAVAPEAVFKFQDDAVWRDGTKRGERNSLWIGTRTMTDQERSAFTNGLLPGPTLKAPPAFETGLVARDPLRPFRPKKTAVTAADGANVGVRFEYLPDVPPEG